MTKYRARGNEIVDASGRQFAVVLATNCSKKEAATMAEVAAQEANRLTDAKTALKTAAKPAASRLKAPAIGASACAERDMGGTECPAGNCCRSGMCNRGY